jgi:hypothetical protein
MYHEDADKTEGGGWLDRLHPSWPMLFLAGWLLYELTAQPGLGALVACAKFGWSDVRTAAWLRRVDPDRGRGQTCFWAYITYGLWKVAITATLTMVLLGFLSAAFDRAPRQAQGNNGLSPVLGGALAAATMGFGLSFPTTYIALWSARRHGVRLWLGQAPHRARRERFWPPYHGGLNAAPFVGFTSLVLTEWLLFFTTIFLTMMVPGIALGTFIFGMGMLSMLVVLVALCRLTPRVVARSPQECWTTEEGEAVYQILTAEESASGT